MSISSYSQAIHQAFTYLLDKYPNVFAIGQGLWSPWYVGNTMLDLELQFGKERIIDTPVAELACTGAAIGASLNGFRPIIIHPRMDFMLLAVDQIVNQAAKWHHMMGGSNSPALTIRGIINRGGEQGAQHSQALHAWFAHVPGLRVVMPSTVKDARDLLIASVLCDDPVLYIDDRWLYQQESELPPVVEYKLSTIKPEVIQEGEDVTLVGCSYATYLCQQAANELMKHNVNCEIIDLRVINPLDTTTIQESIKKTGKLVVVDSGTKTAGFAGEIIANVIENLDLKYFKSPPVRITLPDAPAPTSKPLESVYYIDYKNIVEHVKLLCE